MSESGRAFPERRQHPAAIAFDLLKSVRGFLLPGLAVLVLSRGDRGEVWLMAMFVPVTLAQLVRYWTLRYAVRGPELVLREGLLNRNVRSIPLDRVQDIDTEQSPLHRLLGVASVRLRTATDGTPEVELSALSLGAVDELRAALSAARRGSVMAEGAGDVGPDEPGPPERVPDPLEALIDEPAGQGFRAPEPEPGPSLHLPVHALVKLALLHNRGMLALGALFAFLGQYGLLDRLENLDQLSTFAGLPQAVRESLPPLALLGTVLVFTLLSPLFSVPWTLLRYGDFRLRLEGDDLRIEKGWWTRTVVSFPRARIQRVSVKQSPLQRAFGVVSIQAVNAGRSSGEGAGVVELVPILDADLALRFLGVFAPDFRWDGSWNRPHPKARRRLRRLALLRALVLAALLAWPFGWWALLPAVAFWLLSDWRARLRGTWLAWQRSAARIVSREGAFVRRTVVAPVQKIQSVVQRESPFDRRWGMRHLAFDTAGGGALAGLDLAFLAQDASAALAAEVTAEVEASRFRW